MTDEKHVAEKIVETITKPKEIDWYVMFLYGLAAVTGAAGGCAMAAALKAKGMDITKFVALAYAAIGTFIGSVFYVFITARGWIELAPETAIIYGGTASVVVISIILGVNVTIRFGSRKFIKDFTEKFGAQIELDTKRGKRR